MEIIEDLWNRPIHCLMWLVSFLSSALLWLVKVAFFIGATLATMITLAYGFNLASGASVEFSCGIGVIIALGLLYLLRTPIFRAFHFEYYDPFK